MKCALYRIEIDSIDEAIEQGWIPYFYEGEIEHEFVCPGCSEVFLELAEDGAMEVKDEYRGKLKCCDEKPEEHLVMGVMLR